MKVAVLGFGTVGVGVYEMLKNAEGTQQGTVLVRPGKNDIAFKRTSIDEIINDPEIDAAVEVMGGVEHAFTYASTVLKSGKHFITSNKALVAAKGVELSKLAYENNVGFMFSAACGGAVPYLYNLSIARESDKILSLSGILNGTTNYMLDSMQRLGLEYEDALADAQRLGYAEADPTADVSGADALRKIMLGSAVAWDMLPSEGLLNEGIESITASDVRHFQSRGYTCRLMAQGGRTENGGVYAYVEPVLLRDGAIECAVLQNFNLACYEGLNSGRISLMGQGAGRYPTASAVLRDISSIMSGRKYMLRENCRRVEAQNDKCSHLYYARLPESMGDRIPAETAEAENGVFRIITKSMSVKAMHEYAGKIREDGGEIFFAAIGE